MKIIDSIYEEPEKWRITQHYFIHENGFKLWIGNGMFFVSGSRGGEYSFLQKYKIYKAFRHWRKHAPMSYFGDKS